MITGHALVPVITHVSVRTVGLLHIHPPHTGVFAQLSARLVAFFFLFLELVDLRLQRPNHSRADAKTNLWIIGGTVVKCIASPGPPGKEHRHCDIGSSVVWSADIKVKQWGSEEGKS